MRHFFYRFGVSGALHKVLQQRTVFSDTPNCLWDEEKILSDQNCSITIGKPSLSIRDFGLSCAGVRPRRREAHHGHGGGPRRTAPGHQNEGWEDGVCSRE